MNPLERLHDIEARLNAGTISIDQACKEVFTGPKHWHTSWWKAQRSARMASTCATCGASEPPLVLQHTWQPIKWREALQQAGPPDWYWWKERHPLPDLNQPFEPLVNTPVCPHCGSHRVRTRVRTKDWVCQVGQSGEPNERHTDFAFSEPNYELRPDKKAISRHKESVRYKYDELSRARWEAWLASPEGIENRRLALLLYINDSKRYLSLNDTKTLCKSCAAREDYQHIRRSELDTAQRKEADFDFSVFDEIE